MNGCEQNAKERNRNLHIIRKYRRIKLFNEPSWPDKCAITDTSAHGIVGVTSCTVNLWPVLSSTTWGGLPVGCR